MMAFDVRTGRKLWSFHTIPRKGEFGEDTWLNNSNIYTGHTGAWAPFTVDEQLGYVYIPVEGATGDQYGGQRPGNNLFSSSIVCLDIKTGKRIWHYQLTHHDLWDYDMPTAPILADINVNGKPIKAVVQLTKQAFAFVFDRTNGTAGVADRRAARSAVRRAGREDGADAAVPDQAAGGGQTGVERERPHRLHAADQADGARCDQGLSTGADVHASVRRRSGERHQRHVHVPGFGRRGLGRRRVRSRDRVLVRRVRHADRHRGVRADVPQAGRDGHPDDRHGQRGADDPAAADRQTTMDPDHRPQSQYGRSGLAGPERAARRSG